jgi:RES domain
VDGTDSLGAPRFGQEGLGRVCPSWPRQAPAGCSSSRPLNFMTITEADPVACSNCFTDRGLRMDAEKIGQAQSDPCPNCGSIESKKLPLAGLKALAYRFFVWGSLWRARFGAAPLIQFNEHQTTSIDIASSLKLDVKLIERILGVGFFHYGPRLWMVGEIEPLKALQAKRTRAKVIQRIVDEYPTKQLSVTDTFFRIRVNPAIPDSESQYDSPPDAHTGRGRLDSLGNPVLYASSDIEICIHECRVSAEDEIFVATLAPTTTLRLLDLTHLLIEKNVSEFESLDIGLQMIFLAGKHSYRLTRAIAEAARGAGFDGVIYPSYFSLLRLGHMPFETVYGISHRRIPQYQEYEQSKSIPNLAIFGKPISEGKVSVSCINRVILSRVSYDFHYGPTGA